MTYSEAVAFLYDRLPAFERGDGPKAIKPGLDNIRRLMVELGDPHTKFPSIHVGGTNGKGSTSHMLAAVYQAAGYTVGLHTSPHLKSFTERIRINGQPIPEADVVDFVRQNQAAIETIEPSFFEVSVAMAFDYFARMQVDLAIIEVGLGGRLDSTNIITPVLSVITNVGLDHQEFLGDTLEAIATEKAGIIKSGVPVVISEYQAEVVDIWKSTAIRLNCKLYMSTEYVKLNNIDKLTNRYFIEQCDLYNVNRPVNYIVKLDLLGSYQQKNVGGVLVVLNVLTNVFPVSQLAIEQGLAQVTTRTGLKGRWQVLGDKPLLVADTAHNLPGIEAVLAMVNTQVYQRLHIILGVVADKDIDSMLASLPKDALYYFCAFRSMRAKPAGDLMNQAGAIGLVGAAFDSVNEAIAAVQRLAAPDDLILVTGSTYLVAEIDSL